MKALLIFSFLTLWITNFAQDSTRFFSADQMLMIVTQYHPVAKQSLIQIEQSKADVLLARSNFDPLLSNYSTRKTVDGVTYYNIHTPTVKIPVWFGVELHAGLEDVQGDYFDPTETEGKTNFVGFSVPLARNLIMDKRRAALKQSKIWKEMAVADQDAALNNILKESMDAYWNWVNAYQQLQVITENVDIAQKRFEWVKKAFSFGERPAIDTLEAKTSYLNLLNSQQKSAYTFQKMSLELSVFLWDEQMLPLELPADVVPHPSWETSSSKQIENLRLDLLLTQVESNHPIIRQYEFKIDALNIEQKLKFQELLPKVDFRYNQLGKGYQMDKTIANYALFENNYQYGLKIEMPLFIAAGRAEYRKAGLKIDYAKSELDLKRFQLTQKIKAQHQEYLFLKQQIELQNEIYQNYLQLVQAEEMRFTNGESSLFLVNSRQTMSLEALQKLIDLKTNYHKVTFGLQATAGMLF